jgi:predicted O-methyltransferase YrrM
MRGLSRFTVTVEWLHREPGQLTAALPRSRMISRPAPQERLIRERIAITERAGALPLWSGYDEVPNYPKPTKDSKRMVRQVSARARRGRVFSRLVRDLKPMTVVEFGTAFGVSGMYWLTAIEKNRRGRLVTFEPNEAWADLAVTNLEAIGSHFTAIRGTFEDYVANHVEKGSIDLAFIDAIHTRHFVRSQFDMVHDYAHPGAIVVIDDTRFSDDMQQCWNELAHDQRVRASARVDGKVGMVELAI